MDHGTLFITLACLFGLLMTWGIGANDLANVMSTTMGSKAVSVRQAMIIAIVFEFAGAFWGSGDVSNTLRNNIIDIHLIARIPEIFVYCMLSVLLAGTVWMLLASHLGLPVSITNAIVGAIVGLGSVVLGTNAVHWHAVTTIALSWLFAPLISGIVAYTLFRSIQWAILGKAYPEDYAKKYFPVYLYCVGLVLAFMILLKGLKHFGIYLDPTFKIISVLLTGVLVTLIGLAISRRITLADDATRHDSFAYVEKLFSILMAFTACAMVFAHGSNDVAIAVGPMTAVISTVKNYGMITQNHNPYTPIIFLGSGGVILGLLMYGRKVIETVGSAITTLTPSRAFAATLAAASTVIVATSTGTPVSATQTLVGAVLGVGMARGIGALNLQVIRNIFMSWIITLPVASVLAILFFYVFSYFFAK